MHNIGPGCQNSENSYARKIKNNPVPFSTSSIRDNNLDKNQNPGPGTQVETKSSKNLQDPFFDQRQTSNFSSRVDRFSSTQVIKKNTPGPGQQNVKPQSNKWNDQQTVSIMGTSAQLKNEKVNQMRLPSAPSIPASHQVFGYEEADNGELVMQKNPDKVYTGKGVDTVGPGAYNVSRSLERPNGVEWGKAKQKRKEQPEDALGPGSQQQVQPQNVCRDMAFKNKETSAFASTVPRGKFNRKEKTEMKQGRGTNAIQTSIQKTRAEDSDYDEEEEVEMPGPGHYNAHSVYAIKGDYKPSRLQFFGSTQERFKPKGLARLGPGSYELNQNNVSTQPLKGFKGVRSPSGCGFNTGNTRFKDETTEGIVYNPGPGQQTSDGLVDQVNKKVWGRRGIFGSSEVRFVTYSGVTKTPGPGNQKLDPKKKTKKAASSSIFKSGVVRVDNNFEEMGPGPGAQDNSNLIGKDRGYASGAGNPIQNSLLGLKENKSGFNAKEDRFSSNVYDPNEGKFLRAEEKPGPGQQGHSDMIKSSIEKINPYSKAGFGTMDRRFEAKGPGGGSPHKNNIPPVGPGSQNQDNAWVKKSYNMLFAEQ